MEKSVLYSLIQMFFIIFHIFFTDTGCKLYPRPLQISNQFNSVRNKKNRNAQTREKNSKAEKKVIRFIGFGE